MDKYKEVVEALIRFRDERDWAQFHDSKNLALALLLEASELNELFLWKKESQAEEVNPERLKEELADLLITAGREAPSGHLRHCAGKNPEERGEISGRKSKRDS